MGGIGKQRAYERIVELSNRGLDIVSLWSESTEVVRAEVPHYMSPCWYTLDPASLLMTSHFQAELEAFPPEFLNHEYFEEDVNKLSDVARSSRGIQTLHEITGGDPSTAPRWHANMEIGGDQELIAAFRTKEGSVWGAVGLYREPGKPMFDRDEIGFISAIAPHLAQGARTGLLVGEASAPQWPDAPGLIVITESGEVESFTPGAERWMADLPDGDWDAGLLPSAVRGVAAQAIRTGEGAAVPGEVASARVLSRSGSWIIVHGAPLVAGGSHRAAVIIEGAHPARITPLLMSVYGLTEREQEVTKLVLQGDSTTQIAAALVVSPHTVQDHLKSVFEKTGVRSRRDLVGKVFFAHYEPRLRDNEHRASNTQPLRGGPFPPGE